MLTQKESTWASDQEASYKTEYASFLSILNVYPTHIKDAQHILSIHKYDQAYHDKQKKQQDNCDKGCMSSKNDNHSTTGNVPDIVEMSFTQIVRRRSSDPTNRQMDMSVRCMIVCSRDARRG